MTTHSVASNSDAESHSVGRKSECFPGLTSKASARFQSFWRWQTRSTFSPCLVPRSHWCHVASHSLPTSTAPAISPQPRLPLILRASQASFLHLRMCSYTELTQMVYDHPRPCTESHLQSPFTTLAAPWDANTKPLEGRRSTLHTVSHRKAELLGTPPRPGSLGNLSDANSQAKPKTSESGIWGQAW